MGYGTARGAYCLVDARLASYCLVFRGEDKKITRYLKYLVIFLLAGLVILQERIRLCLHHRVDKRNLQPLAPMECLLGYLRHQRLDRTPNHIHHIRTFSYYCSFYRLIFLFNPMQKSCQKVKLLLKIILSL